MVKHWLITGGCGFIGISLIERLLLLYGNQIHIRILDNLSVGTREGLSDIASFSELTVDEVESAPRGVELIVGDIRDKSSMVVAQGIDCIIHLAANTGVAPSVENPEQDMETNVIGTFNLLQAAHQYQVDKFIFASSGAPVGECDPPIHEEKTPHPVSPYGASKLAGEGYCSAFYRTFGLKTIALRFGNVYGPRSQHKSSVVAKFIRQAMIGITCEVYGDGTQTRDFIYIDDLLGAIIKAAQVELGGEVFQIATHHERTVNEVVECIRVVLAKKKIELQVGFSEPRLGDVKRNFSDISKARRMLGWSPSSSLRDGIEKTVNAFLEIDLSVRV